MSVAQENAQVPDTLAALGNVDLTGLLVVVRLRGFRIRRPWPPLP